jgi:hypothetical protein
MLVFRGCLHTHLKRIDSSYLGFGVGVLEQPIQLLLMVVAKLSFTVAG